MQPKYKFINSVNFKKVITEHDGLIIHNPIDIAETIKFLPNLKAVTLSFNKEDFLYQKVNYYEFLSELLSTIDLEYLKISSCDELKKLPPNLGNQPVKYLEINNCNYLEDVSVVVKIKSLRTFNYIGKRVNLGASFGNLPLEEVRIDAIVIKHLEEIGKIGSLKQLSIKSFHGEKLPFQFDNFKNLKILWLSSLRNLKVLPSFKPLKSLENLGISKLVKVTKIPNDFKELNLLSSISINSRAQTDTILRNYGELPSSILENTSVKRLGLGGFECLPNSFAKNSSLTWISLNNIDLKSLPDTIGNLTKLETIQISSCPNLVDVSQLRNIKNLQSLSLSNLNALTQMDFDGRSMIHLKRISLFGLKLLESLPRFGEENSNLTSISLTNLPMLGKLPNYPNTHKNSISLNINSIGLKDIPENTFSNSHFRNISIGKLSELDYVASKNFEELDANINIGLLPNFSMPRGDLPYLSDIIRHLKKTVSPERFPHFWFWILNNYGKEELTKARKEALIIGCQLNEFYIKNFFLENLHKLNPDGCKMQDVTDWKGKSVFILGKILEDSGALKLLKELEFTIAENWNEDIEFILVGEKPEIRDDLFAKPRYFFSEIELFEFKKIRQPSFLQKGKESAQEIANLKRLIYSNDSANELLALEMVKNYGLVDEVKMDFLMLSKIASEKTVKEEVTVFLKKRFTNSLYKALEEESDFGMENHLMGLTVNFDLYNLYNYFSKSELKQLVASIYRKTKIVFPEMFNLIEPSSSFRKEIFEAYLKKNFNSEELSLSIGLNAEEINHVLIENCADGTLRSLTIESRHVKTIPEMIYQQQHLEKLKLSIDLSENTIPLELFKLTNLKELTINSDNIAIIPPAINQLTKLEKLNITSTKNIQLPESFRTMKQLRNVYLTNVENFRDWEVDMPWCIFLFSQYDGKSMSSRMV